MYGKRQTLPSPVATPIIVMIEPNRDPKISRGRWLTVSYADRTQRTSSPSVGRFPVLRIPTR